MKLSKGPCLQLPVSFLLRPSSTIFHLPVPFFMHILPDSTSPHTLPRPTLLLYFIVPTLFYLQRCCFPSSFNRPRVVHSNFSFFNPSSLRVLPPFPSRLPRPIHHKQPFSTREYYAQVVPPFRALPVLLFSIPERASVIVFLVFNRFPPCLP